MKFGLAPTQHLNEFKTMQEQAVLAEQAGFEYLWLHEHHAFPLMYPDPIMAAAAVAGVTSRIRLGTAMLLLPLYHPVRVAEAGAMLDVMSQGRFSLGVAAGYSKVDMDTFGVSVHDRGKRMDAGLQIIQSLWRGESVTYDGEDCFLEDFKLFPEPIQKPAPPIYIGGHAKPAIRRAANLGDGYFLSTTVGIEELSELVAHYNEALEKAGRPKKGVTVNRLMCVVDNAKAKQEAIEYYTDALLSVYQQLGHENILKLGDHQKTSAYIHESNLIIGEAQECIERIEDYQARGVEHIACLPSFNAQNPDVVRRSVELMGEHVIPHFE